MIEMEKILYILFIPSKKKFPYYQVVVIQQPMLEYFNLLSTPGIVKRTKE